MFFMQWNLCIECAVTAFVVVGKTCRQQYLFIRFKYPHDSFHILIPISKNPLSIHFAAGSPDNYSFKTNFELSKNHINMSFTRQMYILYLT